MQVHLKPLIDDGPCSQTVRERRWPDGVAGPACVKRQALPATVPGALPTPRSAAMTTDPEKRR
jgi:hypothetical protein